jgi:RNA polymerase sigma factor (sigma-70 family)
LTVNDPEKWWRRFESDDELAAEELVSIYYDRLVRFARRRLAALPHQVADDEGAVVSALRSFFSGVRNGQFSQLDDEYDLWRVLATITARKAIRQMRVHWKQSGEGNRVDRDHAIEQLLSPEPTPAEQAGMIEQFQRQLDALDDETLKQIVVMRMEGYDTNEIAERLELHVRSVQRKLKLVQSRWLDELNES